MTRMSRKYCKTTSPRKMGFSQKSSCKAQGLLKRTSKKLKGKYVISPLYKKTRKTKRSKRSKKTLKKRSNKTQRSKINRSLYSNGKNKPQIKSGYSSEEIAKKTLKRLKGRSKSYQMQIVNTMYNRAKYHKNQTQGMKDAMRIYKNWLKKFK